jgi:hypothetical protein
MGLLGRSGELPAAGPAVALESFGGRVGDAAARAGALVRGRIMSGLDDAQAMPQLVGGERKGSCG